MKDTIHVQSQEAREKITDVFCRLIALSSVFSVVLYSFLQIYALALSTAVIGLLFFLFTYLNKKKLYAISREAIIVTTNLGIVFFSMYLGFDSGIYLYLFVAPLLVYLLVDFKEFKRILFYLLFYLSSFCVIYILKHYQIQLLEGLELKHLDYIYFFNFCSAFIICFGLILYFATNNYNYIQNLKRHKELLANEVQLRTESEDLLKKSIKERELLLSEVHHRVKNNLSIISAFINMQLEHLEDDRDKEIFDQTKDRIYTMALIHNMLYQNGTLSNIDFKEYSERFCQYLQNTLFQDNEIKIKREIEAITMPIDTAIPLAMILNELVSNAYKHAFVGRDKGSIVVGLKRNDDNSLLFWVKDNGIGADHEILESPTTGMTIVVSLVDQIEGTLEYRSHRGSLFSVLIPETSFQNRED